MLANFDDGRKYEEDEMLMLSGIQHFVFCKRQWGLIHLEQQWAENVLTFEGRQMHRRADDPYFNETRGDVLISRAMPLVSSSLGLYGVADVVEFHAVADTSKETNKVKLSGRRGWWRPYPVEYKRGNKKEDDCDEAQLCAQAIALEDIFGITIIEGALYYGERERRVPVKFDSLLRERVRKLSLEMHEAFASGVTAKPVFAPKCKSCSLVDICKPKMSFGSGSTERYMREYLMDDTPQRG